MTGLLFAFLLATPQERPPLLSLEVGSPEPAEAHLPTAPGTTWTYRWTHDYVAPGTTDTITARWTQEVTITDTVRTQHGLILLRGERVSDRTATTRDGRPFPLQESDRFVSPAASLLLRGPNVYEVTGSHDELDSWIVRLEEHTPILFFPMQTGLRLVQRRPRAYGSDGARALEIGHWWCAQPGHVLLGRGVGEGR